LSVNSVLLILFFFAVKFENRDQHGKYNVHRTQPHKPKRNEHGNVDGFINTVSHVVEGKFAMQVDAL
jgi:hypothetical protein